MDERRVLLPAVLLMLLGVPWACAQMAIEAAYNIGDAGYASTPAVGDIDADGHPEIVFGTLIGASPASTGHLDVIRKRSDNSVDVVFSKDLGGAVFSPAIGDIDKDGFGEIVVYVWSGTNASNGATVLAGETGHVVCLDYQGNVVWDTDVGAPPHRNGGSYNLWNDQAPALGDVNGDAIADVAIYLGDANVHVIDGANGNILWVRPGGNSTAFYIGKTAIVDINEDDSNEVLSAGGLLKVYDSAGSLLWEGVGTDLGVADIGTENAGVIDPTVLDGRAEIIASKIDGMDVYSSDGRLLWSYSTPQLGSGVAIADFDLDDVAEIAFGSRDGFIVMLQGDGTQGWTSGNLGIGEWDNPDLTATDLNGDFAPEVTAISDDWAPVVLDGLTGTVIEAAIVAVNENEHSPAIADVDNDQHAEIIFSGSYGAAASLPNTMIVVGNDGSWVDTRNVWNMMTYYVSNIEEDTTLNRHARPWQTYNVWRSNQYNFACRVLADVNPRQVSVCEGQPVTLDAADSLLFNCFGAGEYEWTVDGNPVLVFPGSPDYTFSPTADATVEVEVRCSEFQECSQTASAAVTAWPYPAAEAGQDLEVCAWQPFTVDGGTSRLPRCAGFGEYRWSIDGVPVTGWRSNSELFQTLIQTGVFTYLLEIRCSTSRDCVASDSMTVSVDACSSAVRFAFHTAEKREGCVSVSWGTVSEAGTLGFWILALDGTSGGSDIVSTPLIPATGGGSVYEVLDCPKGAGGQLPEFYAILELEQTGDLIQSSPIPVTGRTTRKSRQR